MSNDIERLVDEQAVARVIRTVARAIDRLDYDLLASCYHPDASDERHGRVRGIDEFLEWVRPILGEMVSTLHQISTQFVDVDGDVAYAESYCMARHLSAAPDGGPPREWFAYLRYIDRLERRDGTWRILRRVCAYEPGTLNPNTLELVPGENLGGSRSRADPSYRRDTTVAGRGTV
jgi:ketosteroid isomerase-like protein